jgi:hypothetical protein
MAPPLPARQRGNGAMALPCSSSPGSSSSSLPCMASGTWLLTLAYDAFQAGRSKARHRLQKRDTKISPSETGHWDPASVASSAHGD